MHTEPDVTRIVRSWLHEDEHDSADRVLAIVLAEVDTTRQRRAWWPAWRVPYMNGYAKLAIAAAAVLLVAVVGITLLPGGRGGVGGGPTASPSPSPTPSATPLSGFPNGPLAVGRHDVRLGDHPFSFDVPSAGWSGNGEYRLVKGIESAFFFYANLPTGHAQGVYADPCADEPAPAPAQTAADLAAAVASIPGTTLVSGPTDVTIGGLPAKRVEFTITADKTCGGSDGEYMLWWWEAGDEVVGRYVSTQNDTIRVWIIDVGGDLVMIDGETRNFAPAALGEEMDQIVESIQFE